MLAGIGTAQEKKSLVKFSSINSMGFLTGESQTAFTLQTINGLKYKTWFAGVGAGMDIYGYQSIPVFADIRKTFGNKAWQPFVYADAGINYPIYSSTLPRKTGGNEANKFYPTFYGEAGVGLRGAINSKTAFVLSVGFSYKHFRYLHFNPYYSPFPTPATTQFDFYYRRLSVRMGIVF